jgi:hypothetical protein
MPNPAGGEKKIFSYDEAAAMLPEVQRLTEEAYRKVEALGAIAAGGSNAETDGKLNDIVNDWARTLVERGLEVKGLWLVDWDNGSGYYCWRYPEDGLHYYHSYEEGFGGRMRIH